MEKKNFVLNLSLFLTITIISGYLLTFLADSYNYDNTAEIFSSIILGITGTYLIRKFYNI